MTQPAMDGNSAKSRETLAIRIGALRDELLRFARGQLRDRESAEDAVQDALTAALAGLDRFDGRASAKTWVFGILRNKIIDRIRSRVQTRARQVELDADDAAGWERLFDQRGHWTAEAWPQVWRDPDAALGQREFYGVLEQCMEQLPETTAKAFAMREVLGLDTMEICGQLGITTNNFHVCMHRARVKLRECLDARWFQLEASA